MTENIQNIYANDRMSQKKVSWAVDFIVTFLAVIETHISPTTTALIFPTQDLVDKVTRH